METKQTTESTETNEQFKIDYNSGKYYEAVAIKLFEVSDTLSAMLGCSKDDIFKPLQSIVVSVVRSKRAALAKRAALEKQQFEEFHKKGVEKAKKHINIFKQLHDLLGDDAMYYNQVVNSGSLKACCKQLHDLLGDDAVNSGSLKACCCATRFTDLTSCLAEINREKIKNP